MSFAEDMENVVNKTIAVLSISLQAKAKKTAITLEEYINLLRASGMADSEIRKNLLADLNEGGRIFGEFYRGLGIDITGQMGVLSRSATALRFGFQPKQECVWVSVSIQEGDKACPDCEPRHGEVDTYESWTLRGLPKSGFSVCRTNCKCVLMKTGDVEGEETLKQPLRLERRKGA